MIVLGVGKDKSLVRNDQCGSRDHVTNGRSEYPSSWRCIWLKEYCWEMYTLVSGREYSQ